MRKDTLPQGHFEALYQARPDPWHLATSRYEAEKYADTLAALPRPQYRQGLEIGCAIGVLTEMLSRRCHDLLALEPIESALAEAKRRNADHPHVRFAPMFVPRDWPAGRFDLILLSEVIDYLGEADVEHLAERVEQSLEPGGDMILVHWIGKKKAGVPSGNEASDRFIAATRGFLVSREHSRNAHYRLDLLHRAQSAV